MIFPVVCVRINWTKEVFVAIGTLDITHKNDSHLANFHTLPKIGKNKIILPQKKTSDFFKFNHKVIRVASLTPPQSTVT